MHLSAALILALAQFQPLDLPLGPWRGVLDCPGGELPFGFELARAADGTLDAVLINGSERRALSRVELSREGDRTRLVIHCDPYDSRLEAKLDGDRLSGEWIRYRNADSETRLPFHARAGAASRFDQRTPGDTPVAAIAGRWRVNFSSSDDPAVGLFEVQPGGRVEGTFLTTLGDYRTLEGVFDGRLLRLSVFDGAHAFLFKATTQDDGSLAGGFWSRDSWHETWTAVLDPEAKLPDGFGLTRWTGSVPLSQLAFPDLEGRLRALDDEAFAGRARLMVLFGSWCPNCYDETHYLTELHERFGDRGLSILGLAFEFGDDLERQRRVLKRYVEHHGVKYPILIAGTSDKAKASQAFPLLDRVRAYPTTIFMDAKGQVRAVYTGFSGPATGAAHAKLRERFETLVEELLAGGE
jgi:thiol-disulfide isomerase/thioredoxin